MAGLATYTIAGRQVGGHYVCPAEKKKSHAEFVLGCQCLT